MPSTSRAKGQALSGAALRDFRHKVAVLKSKGLVSKYKDARVQKPTRYMRAQVEKYSDVLEGRATVLHMPQKRAKSFADKLRVKGRSVVVPHRENEHVSYSAKTNKITSRRRIGDHIATTEYLGSDFSSVSRFPELKENQKYQVTFAQGLWWRFDTKADLIAFMYPYEHPDPTKKPKRKPWEDWHRAVSIVTVSRVDADTGDEE